VQTKDWTKAEGFAKGGEAGDTIGGEAGDTIGGEAGDTIRPIEMLPYTAKN